MSSDKKDPAKNKYVFPYNPSSIPLWVWGILLGMLFFLFVIGIYYATKGNVVGPSISDRQIRVTGGLMNTPGAV